VVKTFSINLLIFLILSGCYLTKNCQTETVKVTGLERASRNVLAIGKAISVGKESFFVSFSCQHGQFKIYHQKIRGIKVGDNVSVRYYFKHNETKSDSGKTEKTTVKHIYVID
jgi:hypothetical protein